MEKQVEVQRESVTLNNCEREQIHLSGSIQPQGVLVFVEASNLIIRAASANAELCFGVAASELFGKPADQILAPAIINILKETKEKGWLKVLCDSLIFGERKFDCTVSATEGGWFIECEEFDQYSATEPKLPSDLEKLQFHVPKITDIQLACDKLALQIFNLIGFDRVMIYRFREDFSGYVFSESVKEGVESFLHLNFPASDIPEIPRNLYQKNRIRLISNVDYEPVPIQQQSGTNMLDLTYSQTRSVSPIHIQYLKNMQVAASFSISIIVNNELWGLIACHNEKPMFISPKVRVEARNVAASFSAGLGSHLSNERFRFIANTDSELNLIIHKFMENQNVREGVSETSQLLMHYMEASGMAAFGEDYSDYYGESPATDIAEEISKKLNEVAEKAIFVTHKLGLYIKNAETFSDTASGAIMLRCYLKNSQRVTLLFFRPELPKKVTWAGNPEKKIPESPTLDIHPRKSFERWTAVTRGQSEYWSNKNVTCAHRFIKRLSQLDL
jgi:light-regulated signal transduction histidine kinase (bacteriophytochrome)